MLQYIGLGVVEVDSNELIIAGKNKDTNAILLMYGIYKSNGELDITMKSNSMIDIRNVVTTINEKYCFFFCNILNIFI